jgi:hypothetical protein
VGFGPRIALALPGRPPPGNGCRLVGEVAAKATTIAAKAAKASPRGRAATVERPS